MAVELSKTQPELARRQGEDFPVILSNFVAGMLNFNKKKQSSSSTTIHSAEQPQQSCSENIEVPAPPAESQLDPVEFLDSNTTNTTTTPITTPYFTTGTNSTTTPSSFFAIRDSLPTSKITLQPKTPPRPNHPTSTTTTTTIPEDDSRTTSIVKNNNNDDYH
jgi:hypothetical protein